MRDNDAKRRSGRLLAVAVLVLGIGGLIALQRRPAQPPEAERAPAATGPAAFTFTQLPPIAAPPEPEPVVDVPTEPAAAGQSGDLGQPLAEGATQAEIEKYMAKAAVVHAKPSQAGVNERDTHLAELKDSGPGGSQWVEHFRRLQDDWFDIDNKQHLGIEFGDWDCFKGGCTTTIHFDAVETLERFTASVLNGKSTHEWTGPGFCSAPLRTEWGKLEATWIFYAPTTPS